MPTDNTPSARLAAFTRSLTLETVPSAVATRAAHLILDAIGCALAARHEEFAVVMRRGVEQMAGVGPHGVIGSGVRLPWRDAALVNGLLCHGLDYDDTHTAGVIHLSVAVWPAVLATAARHGASGREMLAAYVAGVEAGARIAAAARGGFHRAGWHPTSLVGTFAAALASGRLLGLDEAGLVRAQGIALSLAAGSLQFLDDGSWTKRLHPGWAAQAGMTAAAMAASGMPAPPQAYEGRYGLYKLHLPTQPIDAGLASEGLRADGRADPWELMAVAVKPFPACHMVHGCAEAAITLRQRGVSPEQVRSVRALLPKDVLAVVAEPAAHKRRPGTDYEAKFSAPYAMASGLLRGHLDLSDLEPAAIADPQARALMDRVSCEADPASTYPTHFTGEVVVELADGRVLSERVAVNRGHAERPMTNEEVQAKFMANALRTADAGQAQRIQDAVLGMADLEDARHLETLLTLQ